MDIHASSAIKLTKVFMLNKKEVFALSRRCRRNETGCTLPLAVYLHSAYHNDDA